MNTGVIRIILRKILNIYLKGNRQRQHNTEISLKVFPRLNGCFRNDLLTSITSMSRQ